MKLMKDNEKPNGNFCMNSNCIHYYEDVCMSNNISIDENGKCKSFKEGTNELYNEFELEVKVYIDIKSNNTEDYIKATTMLYYKIKEVVESLGYEYRGSIIQPLYEVKS